MLRFFILATLLCAMQGVGWTQDSGKSLLTAARKRAQDARGKKGEQRRVILEDSLRILRMVPERFPKETPSVARAWLEVGRTLRRLKRGEEAVTALKRVLAFENENRSACLALQELATVYRKQKKKVEAAAALTQIIRDHPEQAMSRARAMIRLASIKRQAKDLKGAEELLRRCLKEHGDLWRRAVDALDALVSLKIRAKDLKQARELLDAHAAALKARFADTSVELRLKSALQKMKSRARLEKLSSAPGKKRRP